LGKSLTGVTLRHAHPLPSQTQQLLKQETQAEKKPNQASVK
jgi:hypothetical protein